MPSDERRSLPVDEPLLESAPLARRLASRWCRPDPATGVDCAWYHGFWQYLRLMRLVTTPEHHANFYESVLGNAARHRGARRVLVAGAADYSMLAHVLSAFRAQGKEPQVTVCDLCETPLALNRWYAERAGCALETRRCDMLEYPEERQFDVICTHSFLGRFAPADRQALAEKWRRLLRPAGLVATVKRIRPGSGTELTGFTADEARRFLDKVRAAAAALSRPLDIEPAELENMADAYARINRTWPLRSREEIVTLFECSGFSVEDVHCDPVATARDAGASGPTALGGAQYVRIVATSP